MNRLVIRDAYALKQGEGVEFFWQTRLPVAVSGRTFTVRGRRGQATVTVPDDCTIEVDRLEIPGELPLAGGAPKSVHHRRVRIRRPGQAGVLELDVRLAVERP